MIPSISTPSTIQTVAKKGGRRGEKDVSERVPGIGWGRWGREGGSREAPMASTAPPAFPRPFHCVAIHYIPVTEHRTHEVYTNGHGRTPRRTRISARFLVPFSPAALLVLLLRAYRCLSYGSHLPLLVVLAVERHVGHVKHGREHLPHLRPQQQQQRQHYRHQNHQQ